MPLKIQNIVPLFTITGVVVAIISLLINTSIKKEEFFLKLLTEYSSTGIHDIFLRVMHTENWYSDKFSNGKFEQDIDKMLMFFNGIIYIKKRHLISQRSFSIFEYMLKNLSVTVRHSIIFTIFTTTA